MNVPVKPETSDFIVKFPLSFVMLPVPVIVEFNVVSPKFVIVPLFVIVEVISTVFFNSNAEIFVTSIVKSELIF